jgi:zinc transporter ZupT
MDYLALLSSIALGGLTVFWFKLQEPGRLKLLNAFTGAYLLCLTVLHLLPELYHGHSHEGNSHLLVGGLILAGFFIQVALDVISMGIEHGHSHHMHGHMPWGVLIGLCLHAFVESLALGHSHGPEPVMAEASRRLLLTSIVIHNFPVSIALLGMLLQSGLSRGRALALLGVFAMMAPLGMFISSHTVLAHYAPQLMALVIGIFMHISTTILFEASDVHRFNYRKLAAIVVGTVLGVLSVAVH